MRTIALGLLLLCVSCAEPKEEQKTNQKETEQKTNQKSKIAKPKKDKAPEVPTPIEPDLGPVDLYEWEFKSTTEAQDKVRACAGYQKEAEQLAMSTFKEATPSSPYWIFAIQTQNQDKTEIVAYCTVIPKTSEIQCNPTGEICP